MTRGRTSGAERGFQAFVGDPFGANITGGNLVATITQGAPANVPEPPMMLPLTGLLILGLAGAARSHGADDERAGDSDHAHNARTLYIWAGDQARVAPDFLAVIDFDEHSKHYGKVIRTVAIPPPGNVGNEPHHCHLSADKNTLACGGLLSLMRCQIGIFFFDVSHARNPKFLFATRAPLSSITDDFYPLPEGGFLVTQMGSASGGAPGRVAEFTKHLQLLQEWPETPPEAGFNPTASPCGQN